MTPKNNNNWSANHIARIKSCAGEFLAWNRAVSNCVSRNLYQKKTCTRLTDTCASFSYASFLYKTTCTSFWDKFLERVCCHNYCMRMRHTAWLNRPVHHKIEGLLVTNKRASHSSVKKWTLQQTSCWHADMETFLEATRWTCATSASFNHTVIVASTLVLQFLTQAATEKRLHNSPQTITIMSSALTYVTSTVLVR